MIRHSRYVSNEDIARMQARYAHLQGDTTVRQQKDDRPKRRRHDTSNIKSRTAEVRALVNEAIDLAEEAMRREERLKAAQVRPDDASRASALNRRGL